MMHDAVHAINGDGSPGGYFAAYVIKAILAHVILEYDLKLGGDGVRPADVYFGTSVMPAMDGRVLFRKRGASAPAGAHRS